MRIGSFKIDARWLWRDWNWGFNTHDFHNSHLASSVWGNRTVSCYSSNRVTYLDMGPVALMISRPGPMLWQEHLL